MLLGCIFSTFPVSNLFFPVSALLLCSLPLFLPISALVLFLLFLSKTIKVKIIDDEEYEKNKAFYIEIGEPHLVESNNKGQEAAGRHDTVTLAMRSLHANAESHWRTFSCLSMIPPGVCDAMNRQQVVVHLTSPHPPLQHVCLCVFVCMCDFIPDYLVAC